MSINVGDVEAVLRMKDEFSGVLKQAAGESSTSFGAMTASFGLAQIGAQSFIAIVKNVASELAECVTESANLGKELHDLSLGSGISAKDLSELHYVVGVTGDSLATLTRASFFMSRQMNLDGPAFSKALREMGVTLEQFSSMSQVEKIMAVSDALRSTADYTKQVEIAMGLMGRAGRESLPTLLEPMRELREEGKRLGIVMGEDDVKAAHEFTENMNRLGLAIEHVKIGIGNSLIPAINEMIARMQSQDWKQSIRDLIIAFGGGGGLMTGIDALAAMNRQREGAGRTELYSMHKIAADKAKQDAQDAAEIAWWNEKLLQESISENIKLYEYMEKVTKQIALDWERSERAARELARDTQNTLSWTIQIEYAKAMKERYGVDAMGRPIDTSEFGKAREKVEEPFQSEIDRLKALLYKLPSGDKYGAEKLQVAIDWQQEQMRRAVDSFAQEFFHTSSVADATASSLQGVAASATDGARAIDALSAAIGRPSTSANVPGLGQPGWGVGGGTPAAKPTSGLAALSMAPSWSNFGPWGTTPWWAPGPRGFADGGRVTSPTLALIGEREPETITPDSKAGGITVIINAQGASFQTPQDISRVADRTKDGLLDALRSRGYRV